MSDRLIDVTPTERAAIVTRELMRGGAFTEYDVAEMTECDRSTGLRLLQRLSRVLPLYEDDGRWRLLDLNLNIW